MSQNEVIIDEQALADVANTLAVYTKEYREMLEAAIRKIKLNSTDWNDEDFNALLSAISSFMADVEAIEDKSKQLFARIETKIDAIHELHSLKI